jgi:hypothetical protein
MKRTDTVIKIAISLLFVAMLAYMGVYVLRALQNPLQTSLAVETSMRRSGYATGIVVREEQVLVNHRKHCSLAAEDGKKVAAGAVLAMAYDSALALERASRMRELELEIALGEAVLRGRENTDDLLSYDTAVRAAVLDFAADIASHNLNELDRHCLSLRSLLFSDAKTDVTQEGLNDLKRELEGLRNSSTSDTESLTSADSGLFSTVIDGYEYLRRSDLENLTPEGLRGLIGSRQDTASGVYGKLVTGFQWYFAAVMDFGDAQNLSRGESASLEFGRYYSTALDATVVSVGFPDKNNQCVAVFSCSSAMADTLAMRQVTAEVVFEELHGIRVPYEAVHAEDGQAFVYTVTGFVAERKDISILCDTGEYYLAAAGGALRAGNDIIVGGKDIYDGKVLA